VIGVSPHQLLEREPVAGLGTLDQPALVAGPHVGTHARGSRDLPCKGIARSLPGGTGSNRERPTGGRHRRRVTVAPASGGSGSLRSRSMTRPTTVSVGRTRPSCRSSQTSTVSGPLRRPQSGQSRACATSWRQRLARRELALDAVGHAALRPAVVALVPSVAHKSDHVSWAPLRAVGFRAVTCSAWTGRLLAGDHRFGRGAGRLIRSGELSRGRLPGPLRAPGSSR
jgi:hypothetical protein